MKSRRQRTPVTPGDVSPDGDMSSCVYAALALAFTADSTASLLRLETVFTFVERTVELIAERTCRCADGSILIIAEGDDSEDRLRKIAQEVQAWFEENVGGR